MTAGRKDGFAVWLTGLPSSGKSAIAGQLQRLLAERGIYAQLLDSDELRNQLTPHPAYSDAERKWFYEVMVFIAALLTRNGVPVIIAATGSRREYRDGARSHLPRFAEIHIDCPAKVCRQRDPKGLWRRAEKGEISALPGAGIRYEAPLAPELSVDSSVTSIDEAARHILGCLRQKGFIPA